MEYAVELNRRQNGDGRECGMKQVVKQYNHPGKWEVGDTTRKVGRELEWVGIRM